MGNGNAWRAIDGSDSIAPEVAVAETKTEPKTTGGKLPEPKDELARSGEGSDGEKRTEKGSGEAGPPIYMRALLGFAGLSLLVGFGLDWIRIPERVVEGEETVAAHWASGIALLSEANLGGMPAAVLLVVPILGVLLSAAAFMGFRWAGHLAVGIASSLLLYGLWVVLRLFVEHTGLGLWVTVGGTFITLLLGVIALMLGRARGQKAPPRDEASSSKK